MQLFKDKFSPEHEQQDLNVKDAARLEYEPGEPVKKIINWKNLKPSKQPYKVACLELQWIFDADSKVKLSQLFPNLNGNEDIHLVMSQVCTKEQIK